jgi:hypothetical membrane protein
MDSFRTEQVVAAIAFSIGCGGTFVTSRAPKRGWVGVVLLVVASLAWALIEADPMRESFSMLVVFLIMAPIAVVYSFKARRSAPDKTLATAGFVGSFIVGLFLLFMVSGLIFSFLAFK